MNKKLKDGVLKNQGELIVLKNWTNDLLQKHAQLKAKAEKIASMEDQYLSKYAAQECKAECDNFMVTYEQWEERMEKAGMLDKDASWGDFLGSTAGSLLDTAGSLVKDVGLPALIAVPAMLGASTSYVWNKMTSPGEKDMANMQKSIYLNKIKSKLARIDRKAAMAKKEEEVETTGNKKGRTLRL